MVPPLIMPLIEVIEAMKFDLSTGLKFVEERE
jgi:hypothetical protein